MFQIRPEHVLAFETDMRRRFAELLTAQLRTLLPQETANLPEAVLRQRVSAAVGRSYQYGIIDDPSAFEFVKLCFRLGDRFESTPQHAWAAPILNNTELEGEAKIAALYDHLESGVDDELRLFPPGEPE